MGVVNVDTVVALGREALIVTLLTAAPMLLAGMVVGLTISLLQSVTQIQEITLTFVPKIVVVMLAFMLFLPWMVSRVMGFVEPLLGGFTDLVK